MAFPTLATIRTDHLNPALGLSDDSRTTFGDSTARNAAISHAFARLWPTMARLRREAVTVVNNQVDYTTTGVVDVEGIEVLDSQGVRIDRVTDFEAWADESADPAVYRLFLTPATRYGDTSTSYRVVGYSPYAIPLVDADTCDLPDRYLHVVVIGAQAYLYRAQFNVFVASQQKATDNSRSSTSASEMFGMYQSLEQQFQQAMKDNRRSLVWSKRASPTRRS